MYAFPPVTLLPVVLDKVIRDKAKVIVVAPRWPHRPWFTTLLHHLIAPPVALPPRQDLLSQQGSFYQQPGFLKLTAWKISGEPSLGKEFRRRLSTLPQQHGERGPGLRTTHSGLPSWIGVVNGVSIPLQSL